jgi:hypothetical protein
VTKKEETLEELFEIFGVKDAEEFMKLAEFADRVYPPELGKGRFRENAKIILSGSKE